MHAVGKNHRHLLVKPDARGACKEGNSDPQVASYGRGVRLVVGLGVCSVGADKGCRTREFVQECHDRCLHPVGRRVSFFQAREA